MTDLPLWLELELDRYGVRRSKEPHAQEAKKPEPVKVEFDENGEPNF